MKNDDLYLEQILVGPMDNFVYLIEIGRAHV